MTDYQDLCEQLAALLEAEHDAIANAANTAALIFQHLPELNWAGFYFLHPAGDLILGPFQGKPACTRIGPGQGVCGTAASTAATQRVADVQAFPGHIACDAASRSEIVVPLLRDGVVIGVLDLDSPSPDRFNATDQAGLERVAALYVAASG